MAVGEELRPEVARDLGFSVPPVQEESWNTRVSWALIEMRYKRWVSSPFCETGNRKGTATAVDREWIRINRPLLKKADQRV